MDTDPGTMLEADAALTAPPETPEVESPPEAVEASPEGEQPRDELGRFTSPQQDEAPAEETPPAESAAPAPEPETPPAEAEESFPEVTYRADGQEFAIPGSAVGEDGTFIPADQWTREVLPLLAEGRAARGSVLQRLSEASQREQTAVKRAEAAEAQAQQVLSHFESLIEKGQIGDWLQNVQQNWPVLKAEARAKALELAQQAERAELTRYRDQERMVQLRPLMDQTLRQSVARYGMELGIDEQVQAQVLQRLQDPQFQQIVFVPAPYDDPSAGIRQGETVINNSVVQQAFQFALIGRGTQQRIAQAQQANAAQQAKPKIPPVVGGKGAKAPKPVTTPTFKSARDADEWFQRGGYHELDTGE